VSRRYAVKIPVTSGFDVLHVPDATREVFQQHLNSFNDWSLVGRFVFVSNSVNKKYLAIAHAYSALTLLVG